MRSFKAVVPKININDAVKQKRIDSSLSEYIIGKNRDNLFLTQTCKHLILKKFITYIKLTLLSTRMMIFLSMV